MFRDAVTVTRGLGIKYIWIDSLCIIQDDDEDWENESRRMEQVFSAAYCTNQRQLGQVVTGGLPHRLRGPALCAAADTDRRNDLCVPGDRRLPRRRRAWAP